MRRRYSWKTLWRKLQRRGALALLASSLACTAAACQQAKPGAAEQPAAETPPPAKPVSRAQEPAPPPVPVYRAPLTGLALPEKADSRPVMVMVNNHPSARPQSGLSQADLLYESLAEGEITRLVAVFQKAAEQQGIRAMTMPSGAGHDSQQMAHVAKVVMLFVRSRDGRSHTPEEFTSIEHATLGIEVLAEGLHRLAY